MPISFRVFSPRTPRAVVGALIGCAMLAGCETVPTVGEQLDNADLAMIASTTQQALETNKVGQSANWINTANGHRGTVTPTRTFTTSSGTPCRNYQQSATIGGQTVFAFDTACRLPSGSWASTRYGSLTDAIRLGQTDYAYADRPYPYGYYNDPWCNWRDPFCGPSYGYGSSFGFGFGFGH
jgi:surface antigen